MCKKLWILELLLCLVAMGLLLGGSSCGKKKSKSTAGSSVGDGSGTTVTAPTAPSALDADVISSTQINLNWTDNANNETGFKIERKTGVGGTYAQIATVTADVVTYNDTGLLLYTTYYYRVRAWNDGGDSSYSPAANATTDHIIIAAAAGDTHALALTTNGTVWSWGYNLYGQLGLGDSVNRLVPNLIVTDYVGAEFKNITAIAGGGLFNNPFHYSFSLALKSDGTIWSWGLNSYGQLGLGNTFDTNMPTKIDTNSNWITMNAGGFHAIAQKQDGTLWTWGRNDFGQLGLGYTSPLTASITVPTRIENDTDWVAIAAGAHHTISLKSNGKIWSWGLNSVGQLGLGNTTNSWTPTQIGNYSDWSKIDTGEYHTIGLRTNKTLWTWGYNNYGQLGLANTTNSWTPTAVGNNSDWFSVSGGGSHTISIKTNRTLWTWGLNFSGQLGLGNTTNSWAPIQVGIESDWSIINAGYEYSLGIKNNKTLWAWGGGSSIYTYGQLGVGDTINRNTPTLVNLSIPYTTISSLTGSVISLSRIDVSWIAEPANEDGFKIERKISEAGTYQEIGTVGQDVSSWADTTVSGGIYYYYRVCAFNNFGNGLYSNELGLATSGNWFIVAAGGSHTMHLKADGTLWTWGLNAKGQLGLNDITERLTPTQVGNQSNWIGADSDWFRIAGGGGYTTCIKTDRTLWAWGVNGMGQLGLNDTISRTTPANVGNDSDWSRVAAGRNTSIQAPSHTIGLKTDRTLWAWGYNNSGQLGLGDTTPTSRTTPTKLNNDTDWVAIAGGDYHTISLKSNGKLWAWGDNSSGQLGLSDTVVDCWTPTQVGTESDWNAIAAGSAHTISLKTDRTLWTWGDNGFGQLGLSDTMVNSWIPIQVGTESDWLTIAAGTSHTMSLKTNRTLWTWGYNNYGQLGLGDTLDRWTPVQVGYDSDWLIIAAGRYHTISRKNNGTLWAWGYNSNGQLGLNNKTNKWIPTIVEER